MKKSRNQDATEQGTIVFRLQKIRKHAEIFFFDGGCVRGSFFVSPRSENHSDCERVQELLADERSYLPFETEEGVTLIQKGSIEKVLLGENELKGRNIPNAKEIKVEVRFLSGEAMEGKVYLDLPESRFRLSDFLNASRSFFYLEADGRERLINTRFVKAVREHRTA
jgi:hypothetical protein